MKLIKLIVLLWLCAFGVNSYSQISKADSASAEFKKVAYFFSLQSGALFGDQVTFSASTIHGVKLGRKLRVGAGIGFDSFEDAQTMPLFGSASWDLFGKKNVVFVQMNYGWAPYAWTPALKDSYGFKKINGGETFSAMIGYRIKYGDVRLAMLVGYKHQEVKIYSEYPIYYYSFLSSIAPGGYPTNSQTLSESMNRFAVSLSVGWR